MKQASTPLISKLESKLNNEKLITKEDLIACGNELVYEGVLAKNTILDDFKAMHPDKETD